MRLPALLLAFLGLAPQALAGPSVTASIMPVHSIVSAVMGDTGTPELLLRGRLSEHAASFTIDQIAALGHADLVFIVGRGLERKLARIGGSEAVGGRLFIELALAPGVARLAIREGGAWEPHRHEAEGGEAPADHADDAGVLTFDPHVWLDPDNGKAMAAAVAAALSGVDPANAAIYAANVAAFSRRIDDLSAEIAAVLQPVADKPFVVFHDAYRYFERRFGLAGVGSIADVSAAPPSAARLRQIRARIAETGAVCVFREPQFDGRAADVAIEGRDVRSAVLDPLGADLQPGPDAYPQLLRNLAVSLRDCLAG